MAYVSINLNELYNEAECLKNEGMIKGLKEKFDIPTGSAKRYSSNKFTRVGINISEKMHAKCSKCADQCKFKDTIRRKLNKNL